MVPALRCASCHGENHVMLAYEDEPARQLFAVYVRPEGERGSINFYADEAAAAADVGPGMPEGFLTHGEVYVEYIGDALLFAPADWPLTGVDQDLLVQLQADTGEIFIALTPAESGALMALAIDPADAPAGAAVVPEPVDFDDTESDDADLVAAPAGLTGTDPCLVWFADGSLVAFASGPDGGGHTLGASVARGEFGDEPGADRAVVAMLDEGWVPLVDDPYTWREVDDLWVINIQKRVVDADELFFARYTADDRTLVVTRAAADTDHEEEHLQLITSDVDSDFIDLGRALVSAGWRIDSESTVAAELSAQPELRKSPGWYPAEPDEDDEPTADADTAAEWVCVVARASAAN